MNSTNDNPMLGSGELISMLGGRLQFHPVEPLVIIDDLKVPFGPIPTSVLQALAQPLGAYIDRNALFERIWEEPYYTCPTANTRLFKAVTNTRRKLSAGFGTGTGHLLLTSTASSAKDLVRYALYDPPHLHKRTRTYPQKIT
jgi:hypothetical protein